MDAGNSNGRGYSQLAGNAANDLIELPKAQAAKELKLDMNVKGN
jgi:hypothetical protein